MTKEEGNRRYIGRPSPFPFETLKRCYVTRFGGVSIDLDPHQVGINQEALERNTRLSSEDQVALGILGKGRTRPYFMENLYEVTALDLRTPDALEKSALGEAVFSEGIDLERKPFNCLREGELVVLSGVLAEKKTGDRDWRLDLLAKALRELHVLET